MSTEQKFLYGTGANPLSIVTHVVPDMVVYVVTGHCDYEDCACVAGVFTDKAVAEKYRQECEEDPKRHYSYFQVDPIVLDHPEKEAE